MATVTNKTRRPRGGSAGLDTSAQLKQGGGVESGRERSRERLRSRLQERGYTVMFASPSGGWWISCFSCGGADVVGEVTMLGRSDGTPILLQRGCCELCAVLLLSLDTPVEFEPGQWLLEVALQLPAL
jgi:hypothetical protein